MITETRNVNYNTYSSYKKYTSLSNCNYFNNFNHTTATAYTNYSNYAKHSSYTNCSNRKYNGSKNYTNEPVCYIRDSSLELPRNRSWLGNSTVVFIHW